ncbi:hypothetical protein [Dyella choica]|uniref:Uncharacterized protein n=1 Tax=Dyella choica TaxID=1927959 RepID=A0A3S0RKL9_9GAMM|nr:hypothetical protein [Dyella choica]RUL75431.1 hypothetical protein EKH80_11985 [Dyella choica]
MNGSVSRPFTLDAARWIVGFLSIGPLAFPLDWLFHVFPDRYPAFHSMHGIGPAWKAAWVLCGLLGAATFVWLRRRPMLGFVASILLAALYVPTAMVMWAQFSYGCFAALLAMILSGIGALAARRSGYAS